MKVKKTEEFELICAELKERSDALGALMSAEEDLIERRDKLFVDIILDNKYLEGEWEVNANRWLSVLLLSKKLKRDVDFRKLMTIGYNIEDRCYIHFPLNNGLSLRVTDDNVRWQLEIFMRDERNLDELFKFFKDSKIKIEYSIMNSELRDLENRLKFLRRLAGNE